MKNKEFLDDVADYANHVIHYIDDINSTFISKGNVSYQKYDLIAVYKMNKMLESKIITEEHYYRLMNLYYHYLELDNTLFWYIQELSEAQSKQLFDRLELIKSFLRKYELLPEYFEYDNIIDSSITRLLKQKNK